MLIELGREWKTHRNRRWLFPSRSGTRPVSPDVVARTVSAAARATGLTRRVTPHMLASSPSPFVSTAVPPDPTQQRDTLNRANRRCPLSLGEAVQSNRGKRLFRLLAGRT
jgi:hypothetical protein